MFSRQQLIAELPLSCAQASPALDHARFVQDDFETPESEEEIWAFRGSKRDFPNPVLFWIKALQSQDWSERDSYFRQYLQEGLCEPITESEFARIVASHSYSLRPSLPDFLLAREGFQAGLRMRADWNDVAAIAELTDVFVAFFWFTTA